MAMATIDYVMDSTKAEKMIGYNPAFTVKEGLAQTIEDHIKYFPEGQLAKTLVGGKNTGAKKDD